MSLTTTPLGPVSLTWVRMVNQSFAVRMLLRLFRKIRASCWVVKAASAGSRELKLPVTRIPKYDCHGKSDVVCKGQKYRAFVTIIQKNSDEVLPFFYWPFSTQCHTQREMLRETHQPGTNDPDLLNTSQYAVQFVETVVMNHQLAIAFGGMLKQYFGSQFLC